MEKIIDIRQRPHLSGDEVKALNFISGSDKFIFRKHYRSGLRSHIFEILHAKDVTLESEGCIMDGIRSFPRARPVKMLRILRNRFSNKAEVFREIEKYRILLKWLGPELIAGSEEFMVHYTGTGTPEILLCGLQEYISGTVIDPWRMATIGGIEEIISVFDLTPEAEVKVLKTARQHFIRLVKSVRQMIHKTGFIPDLAGNGNLMVTASGNVKLVDINNIVEMEPMSEILIDDKGYPSCDVSVQVLAMLETSVLKKAPNENDSLYRIFLAEDRVRKVKALERTFYKELSRQRR